MEISRSINVQVLKTHAADKRIPADIKGESMSEKTFPFGAFPNKETFSCTGQLFEANQPLQNIKQHH